MKLPFSVILTANRKGSFSMLIDKIALILMIIGGLNWGLIGIFKLDLVALLCGGQTGAISRIVYTLVGLAAAWCISLLFRQDDTTQQPKS